MMAWLLREVCSCGARDALQHLEKSEGFKLTSVEALKHPALLQYLAQCGIGHEVACKYYPSQAIWDVRLSGTVRYHKDFGR